VSVERSKERSPSQPDISLPRHPDAACSHRIDGHEKGIRSLPTDSLDHCLGDRVAALSGKSCGVMPSLSETSIFCGMAHGKLNSTSPFVLPSDIWPGHSTPECENAWGSLGGLSSSTPDCHGTRVTSILPVSRTIAAPVHQVVSSDARLYEAGVG